MTSLIHKLGWRSVAAMTADGERYADYMASLQDILQHNHINFKINRKFPTNTEDLTPVSLNLCHCIDVTFIFNLQYLDDLKDRGAKIIIGDFYEDVARKVNIIV